MYDSRENCNAIIETETNLLVKGCNKTIIPESVTEIGATAFSGCAGLTSVVIPESVTKIGSGAFRRCKGLTSIAVAPGNKVYDSREGCNAIIDTLTRTLIQGCTTTKLPEGVGRLGAYSFAGFTNLANINSLLEGVHTIGEGAFADCTGLTNLTIPESVLYVCSRAFCGCTGLESVVIQNAIADLDSYRVSLFAGCSNLRSVTLPAGIKKIDNSTFRGCDNLNTINVPAKKADYYKKRLPEELHQFIVELAPVKKAKK